MLVTDKKRIIHTNSASGLWIIATTVVRVQQFSNKWFINSLVLFFAVQLVKNTTFLPITIITSSKFYETMVEVNYIFRIQF